MRGVLEIPLQLLLILLAGIGQPVTPVATGAQPVMSALERRVFTEQSWLVAVRRHGGAIGEAGLSHRIFTTTSGHHYVPVAAEAREIGDLRQNPILLRQIALASTRFDAAVLANVLGRAATRGEILLALLSDVRTAIAIIDAAAEDANRAAASIAPDVALRFPELFFSGSAVRSARQVIDAAQQSVARAEQRFAEPLAKAARIPAWTTETAVLD